ncbi:hypothetical protein MBAV_002259 [Candidatus Magnetobacterium bavaricum]|uniref:Uncharacterized protein n=1 Tax=Candidatus Magnetobacterium bavaricum TaxID=29290 RepID=A0A0F3GUM3_9BACT|nr:hypothetical protein MBAV_002259 [Candidatus Magnetobacterium bavaricum]
MVNLRSSLLVQDYPFKPEYIVFLDNHVAFDTILCPPCPISTCFNCCPQPSSMFIQKLKQSLTFSLNTEYSIFISHVESIAYYLVNGYVIYAKLLRCEYM